MDHDPLDLSRHAEILGDPAAFFVDLEGPVPRVVEHATGEVHHVIDAEGQLRPYADYRDGKVPPHELPVHQPQPARYAFGPRPAPAPGANGLSAAAGPSGFNLGITVDNGDSHGKEA